MCVADAQDIGFCAGYLVSCIAIERIGVVSNNQGTEYRVARGKVASSDFIAMIM